MKFLIIRNALIVLLGVLLVCFPSSFTIYFTIALGVLFFVPAVFAILNYLRTPKDEGSKKNFPVIHVGSALFGLWLMIMPGMFVKIIMVLLGATLVFLGLAHAVTLLKTKDEKPIALAMFIMPALMLIAGFFVLLNPSKTANLPWIILGAGFIAYGIYDALLKWRYLTTKDKPHKDYCDVEDVTPTEETPAIDITDAEIVDDAEVVDDAEIVDDADADPTPDQPKA